MISGMTKWPGFVKSGWISISNNQSCSFVKRIFFKIALFAAGLGTVMAFWGGTCSAEKIKGKFIPPDGKVLLMVGQDKDTIDDYVKSVKHVPAGVMLYTSIQNMDGLLEEGKDYGSGVAHGQYLLEQYPYSVIQIGLYMVDGLEDTIAGKYDRNIEKLGKWIKQAARPVYLRIGYEFDLPANRYDPEHYQQAFRYIVDKLRKQGVDNVAFIWHTYSRINPGQSTMAWYPGDDYVDWFALSFFDAYNQANMIRFSRLAQHHQKPLMIAEATPYGLGTPLGERSWNRWFRKFFSFIEDEDVKAACYINSDWDSQPMWQNQGWGNARIQANPLIQDKWRKEIGRDKYLRADQNLFPLLEQNTGRSG